VSKTPKSAPRPTEGERDWRKYAEEERLAKALTDVGSDLIIRMHANEAETGQILGSARVPVVVLSDIRNKVLRAAALLTGPDDGKCNDAHRCHAWPDCEFCRDAP